VSICTSLGSHDEIANRGHCHGVCTGFCEKPMPMNVADGSGDGGGRAWRGATVPGALLPGVGTTCLWVGGVCHRRCAAGRRLLGLRTRLVAMARQVSATCAAANLVRNRFARRGVFSTGVPGTCLPTTSTFMGRLRSKRLSCTPDPETGHPATLEVQLQGNRRVAEGPLHDAVDTPCRVGTSASSGYRGCDRRDSIPGVAVPVPGDGAHKAPSTSSESPPDHRRCHGQRGGCGTPKGAV